MQAVILAGGIGTRLKPFTMTIPKPLMPLGEMPIIEVVIRQLKRDGFDDAVVAVNRLKELIQAFLGDGKRWGLSVAYSVEDKFLGTAAPLKQIDSLEENFLVINGDTLTTIDYRKMFEFHCGNGAAATVATCRRELKVDFGVVDKDESGLLKGFTEKPSYSFEVSMGVNAFNKRVLKYIDRDKRLDLPELILRLKDKGEKILIYPFEGEWLDIGHMADYEAANRIFERDRGKFLKGCAQES